MNVADAVREHYLANLGPPAREGRWVLRGNAVDVLKWSASKQKWGVTIYATIGSSIAPLSLSAPAHRFELYIGLEPERDEIGLTLAAAALPPIPDQKEIRPGHTMTFDEPLWEGTRVRTLWFVRSERPAIPTLELDSDLHIEFLMSIPLFPSELRVLRQLGEDVLRDRWQSAGVDVADPERRDLFIAEDTSVGVPRRVVLYSRRTCHLCDEARTVILAEKERTAFDFEEIFIDGDDELEREYGLRVPVVEVDGAEEFEFAVEPKRFAGLLRS